MKAFRLKNIENIFNEKAHFYFGDHGMLTRNTVEYSK